MPVLIVNIYILTIKCTLHKIIYSWILKALMVHSNDSMMTFKEISVTGWKQINVTDYEFHTGAGILKISVGIPELYTLSI